MGLWLFLSILAPACWGFTNVLDGALRRYFVQDDHILTCTYSLLRLPIVFLLWAWFGFEFPDNGVGLGMLLAGMLWTVMFVPYLQALKREETTRIALFLQTLALFTFLFAYVLLDEMLTARQGFAFLLIMGGGILAAFKRSDARWHFSSAFWLTLFACFFWALSDVLFKVYEPYFLNFWTAFLLFLFGSSLTGFLFLLKPSLQQAIRSLRPQLNLTGLTLLSLSVGISVVGSAAFAYALTLGKVALTSVFIGSQTLFVFLFTLLLAPFFHWVDREAVDRSSLTLKGAAFFLIGLGLILLYF